MDKPTTPTYAKLRAQDNHLLKDKEWKALLGDGNRNNMGSLCKEKELGIYEGTCIKGTTVNGEFVWPGDKIRCSRRDFLFLCRNGNVREVMTKEAQDARDWENQEAEVQRRERAAFSAAEDKAMRERLGIKSSDEIRKEVVASMKKGGSSKDASSPKK